MEELSTKKRRGRPSKGVDYNVSARVTGEQYRILSEYGWKHNIVDKKGALNPSEVIRVAIENLSNTLGESPQRVKQAKKAETGNEIETLEDRLKELRQVQTFDSLMEEVDITWRIVCNTLWCNVAYNPKLYETERQKELLSKTLKDRADVAHDLFSSLATHICADHTANKS